MTQPRSFLYVPADDPDRLAKAPGRGADALICDLEDSVAPDAKDAARRNVAAFLDDAPGCEVWVRVNADERLLSDVRGILSSNLRGIVLPKANVESVNAVAATLDEEQRSIPITPLIETAASLLNVAEIAQAPRVARLGLGEADLCAELMLSPSTDERELMSIRMQVVVASAAAGILAPNGPVSTDYTNLGVFRASSQALKRLGFGSRAAIHPAQIEIINETFMPSPDELARATRLVELFEAAGGGTFTDDEGRMVDEAVVKSARRVLERGANR